MTIRDNIATNLRELCAQRGSIAQACREAGINRQQFNRYITGEAIPNRANLQKICRYFHVSETQLFRAPDEHASQNILSALTVAKDGNLPRIIENLNSKPKASIDDGSYFVYYRMPSADMSIARSVMFVRTDGPQKTFRRITNIAAHGSAKWRYFQGDHKGLIMERRHWLNFIGIAEDGLDEPSLISVQSVAVTPPLFVGTALVYGIAGPLALPVVLESLDSDINPHQALRGCKIFSLDSAEVSPMIKNFLETQRTKIVD